MSLWLKRKQNGTDNLQKKDIFSNSLFDCIGCSKFKPAYVVDTNAQILKVYLCTFFLIDKADGLINNEFKCKISRP